MTAHTDDCGIRTRGICDCGEWPGIENIASRPPGARGMVHRSKSDVSLIERQQKAIDLLLRAIEPFANYHDWAKQWEWPAAVASDSGTPVLGRENYDAGNPPSFTVTVGNFRAARSAKEQAELLLKGEGS